MDDSQKLIIISFGFEKIIVSELSPFFLELALKLLPVACELFLVHGSTPSLVAAAFNLTPPQTSQNKKFLQLLLIPALDLVRLQVRPAFRPPPRPLDVRLW